MPRTRSTFDALRTRHLGAIAGMIAAAIVCIAAAAGAIASVAVADLNVVHCVAIASLAAVVYVSFELRAEDLAEERRVREAERVRTDFWLIVDRSWNA